MILQRLLLPCCLLLFLALSACSDPLDQFSWLEGTWTHADEAVEIWERQSNGNYLGKGGSIERGDTLFYEALAIETKGDQIFYIPNVAHNDGAVEFKLTGQSENSWTFENPEHDFPTLIRYNFIPPESLHVRISGPDEKGTKIIDFTFNKAPNGN